MLVGGRAENFPDGGPGRFLCNPGSVSNLLCDLRQASSAIMASVFSLVKWDNIIIVPLIIGLIAG